MSTPSLSTQPFLNPSPKVRFQSSDQNISKHREMVDRNEFQRACDFALLEYQAKLCQQEPNAGIIGVKIMGAQEFLKEFRLLSEKAELKPLPRVSDNLAAQ